MPGIPVAKHGPVDLRTSMDGKYKEIAEVITTNNIHLFGIVGTESFMKHLISDAFCNIMIHVLFCIFCKRVIFTPGLGPRWDTLMQVENSGKNNSEMLSSFDSSVYLSVGHKYKQTAGNQDNSTS